MAKLSGFGEGYVCVCLCGSFESNERVSDGKIFHFAPRMPQWIMSMRVFIIELIYCSRRSWLSLFASQFRDTFPRIHSQHKTIMLMTH